MGDVVPQADRDALDDLGLIDDDRTDEHQAEHAEVAMPS